MSVHREIIIETVQREIDWDANIQFCGDEINITRFGNSVDFAAISRLHDAIPGVIPHCTEIVSTGDERLEIRLALDRDV